MTDAAAVRTAGRSPVIFMAAGEASADRQGGYPVQAIFSRRPGAILSVSVSESDDLTVARYSVDMLAFLPTLGASVRF